MIGQEIYTAIQNDDLDSWQQLIVSSQSEENPKVVSSMANLASLYGSERIWKSIILKWPDFADDIYCKNNIIMSGNMHLIRLISIPPDAVSTALLSLRPRLAQWLLSNEKCELPTFAQIEQSFALNVLCTLSHPPSRHFFIQSLESQFSCFAKMNIMDSNLSLTFSKGIMFCNPECVKIAFEHHYQMIEESLKDCIKNKKVEIAQEIFKYDFKIHSDQKELLFAAALYDLDNSLLDAAYNHGASVNNAFIQSMMEDFPDDYDWKFKENSPFYQYNLVYFVRKYGRKHNVELLEKAIGESINPSQMRFSFSSRRLRILDYSYKLCFFNKSDAELFPFENYPIIPFSTGINDTIGFIISSKTISDLLKIETTTKMKLILYFGSYGYCEEYAKLEEFARKTHMKVPF